MTPCSTIEIVRRFGKTSCFTKERVAAVIIGLLSKFSSNFYQTTRCYISHKLGRVSCIKYHSLAKTDKKKYVQIPEDLQTFHEGDYNESKALLRQ